MGNKQSVDPERDTRDLLTRLLGPEGRPTYLSLLPRDVAFGVLAPLLTWCSALGPDVLLIDRSRLQLPRYPPGPADPNLVRAPFLPYANRIFTFKIHVNPGA